MKGRALAANRDYELAITTAWYAAAMRGAKKLKTLREYLPSDPDVEVEPVQAEVILDAMLTMQAHGVPMNVEWVDVPA